LLDVIRPFAYLARWSRVRLSPWRGIDRGVMSDIERARFFGVRLAASLRRRAAP
jgi:hypothetical protein